MVSNMRKWLAIQKVYRVIPWDSKRKLFWGETLTVVPYPLEQYVSEAVVIQEGAYHPLAECTECSSCLI